MIENKYTLFDNILPSSFIIYNKCKKESFSELGLCSSIYEKTNYPKKRFLLDKKFIVPVKNLDSFGQTWYNVDTIFCQSIEF